MTKNSDSSHPSYLYLLIIRAQRNRYSVHLDHDFVKQGRNGRHGIHLVGGDSSSRVPTMEILKGREYIADFRVISGAGPEVAAVFLGYDTKPLPPEKKLPWTLAPTSTLAFSLGAQSPTALCCW